MLIRSQDGLSLMNLDNINELWVSGCSIRAQTAGNSTTLGDYDSKEKAIEILDKIEEAYAAYRGGSVYTFSSFKMPQDNKFIDELEEKIKAALEREEQRITGGSL